MLEVILMTVTLFVGWAMWSLLVAWPRGQTPAKQLLGMRVVKLNTAEPGTWGTMFVREVITKTVGSFIATFTLGILYFMLLWDRMTQQVWDKISGTVVVDDRDDQLGRQTVTTPGSPEAAF